MFYDIVFFFEHVECALANDSSILYMQNVRHFFLVTVTREIDFVTGTVLQQ